MPQFTGGPAVRVSPNVSIEFKWITDVAWFGKVEVFDNPDGTGTPITGKQALDVNGVASAATTQDVVIPVGQALLANTGYFFKVTATDPSNNLPDIVTPAPLPPVFTGAQMIQSASASAITSSSATLAWQANVIGFGKATAAVTSSQDTFDITSHAIDFSGLQAGTTYQFTVANLHAIDGDALASATGQFTTTAVPTTVVFTQPHAEPRVLADGQVSAVSIRALNQGNPIPGIVVAFAIDSGSAGQGILMAATATTDANGVATVNFTAAARGLVQVKVTAANATNSPLDIPVVVK
jgi:hypothetical protein